MLPIALHLLILVCISAARAVACWALRISGVEFGIGVGPKVGRFTIGNGSYRINLVPLGEYARMPIAPARSDSPENEGICSIPLWKQHCVNSITLPVLIGLYLAFFPYWKHSTSEVLYDIGMEIVSVFGRAEDRVFLSSWNTFSLPDIGQYLLAATIALNALPLPPTSVGFALGMTQVRWLRTGIIGTALIVLYLSVLLLVLWAIFV